MRRTVLIVLVVCDCFAQTNTTITFTNKNGDIVKDATVVRFDSTKLVYRVETAGGTVMLSDLPKDLQDRFGYRPPVVGRPEPQPITRETNSPEPKNLRAPLTNDLLEAARELRASTTDTFLAKHRGSDLFVGRFATGKDGRMVGEWIAVGADYFQLIGGERDLLRSDFTWDFRLDEEVAVREMFKKFREWQAIALTNKVEDFKKPIARFNGGVHQWLRHEWSFTFSWESSGSHAWLGYLQPDAMPNPFLSLRAFWIPSLT